MKKSLKAHALLVATLALVVYFNVQPAFSKVTNASPEMQIQGRPLAAWVAEAGQQTSEKDPAIDTLVAAGPKILPNLADILLHDPNTDQQWKAALAMGAIAYHHPGAVELPAAVPAFATAVRSEHREVRTYAVQGLAAIGPAAGKTLPLLVQSMQDKDSGVRMSAAEALGRIGIATPQVLAALNKGLSDLTGDVALTSLDSLSKLGHPLGNTIPLLVRLTRDKNPAIRNGAMQTLERIAPTSSETLAALNAGLSDPYFGVRVLATNLLKKVEVPSPSAPIP